MQVEETLAPQDPAEIAISAFLSPVAMSARPDEFVGSNLKRTTNMLRHYKTTRLEVPGLNSLVKIDTSKLLPRNIHPYAAWRNCTYMMQMAGTQKQDGA